MLVVILRPESGERCQLAVIAYESTGQEVIWVLEILIHTVPSSS